MGRTKVPLLIARQTDTLFDDFRDERAAGTMNGTLATDGRNARTDTDTESKLTQAGGLLICAGGKAAPAYGDPARWYPAVTRTAGQMVLFRKLTITDAIARYCYYGIDTNQAGTLASEWFQLNVGVFTIVSGATVCTPVLDTTYDLLMILRAAGALYYWRVSGSVPFTFLGASSTNVSSTLYPGVSNYSAAWTLDRILAPQRPWMQAPDASEGFGSAFGTLDGLGHAEGVAGGIGSGGGGATWNQRIGTWTTAAGVGSASALDGGLAIATVDTGQTNIHHGAALVRAGNNVGLVARYVDADNYVVLFHDGTNVNMVKRVGGAETGLIATAAAYSASKRLIIVADGTSFEAFYNDTKIGATQTIADAVFTGVTSHGLYTTNTGNTFNDAVSRQRSGITVPGL